MDVGVNGIEGAEHVTFTILALVMPTILALLDSCGVLEIVV